MSFESKMHRVILYVLDINEENTPESLKQTLENLKYPEFTKVGEIKTVNIGEWEDDHPLNKRGVDRESYFKTLSSEPVVAEQTEASVQGTEAGPYKLRSDVKACSHCGHKVPLNSWNYCIECTEKNISLVFHDGKLWERDTYRKNPHDTSAYRSEILNFSHEQVVAFLTKELKFQTEGYDDLVTRIQNFNNAARELEIPHRWRG